MPTVFEGMLRLFLRIVQIDRDLRAGGKGIRYGAVH